MANAKRSLNENEITERRNNSSDVRKWKVKPKKASKNQIKINKKIK